MRIWINAQPVELPDGASVADAVAHATDGQAPGAPFAVAVNLQFVPRAQYALTPLRDGDRVEIISPITGG
ncbi:MAG: sulfur carrier protein ThiS [Tepidimonas sp.]|uniref:sulfur carrier protein ThiS n=1 Tax=Tepidimonas sp. TaxID=2002775 RepID=UPI00259FACEF|nr:sulfur carrier protein ThiS [Tepidimonas sp.]MDM7456119.1 sulfur carrier protein ThiS [Tepidimonas sp.]